MPAHNTVSYGHGTFKAAAWLKSINASLFCFGGIREWTLSTVPFPYWVFSGQFEFCAFLILSALPISYVQAQGHRNLQKKLG